VRELNERLSALDLVATNDFADVYDAQTVALVESFQRTRGLPLTGIVDSITWERLGEASWQLGQRLLFATSPYQRGDDVAELQVLLAQLGFNPGRIDGIFGPMTDGALKEFQSNCALEPSGALTKGSLQELLRVRATNAGNSLVMDARDLAGFDPQTSGSVLLCGSGPLGTALAHYFVDSPLVLTDFERSSEDSAHHANMHDVALVLAFQPLEHIEGIHLHYWASYRSHSRRGELMASSLASSLAQLKDGIRVEVTGMALPILRETKMTTVSVEHGPLAEQAFHEIVTALRVVVYQVIHRKD
jgi:N-acetylmuramoyl-L-alanine amidase